MIKKSSNVYLMILLASIVFLIGSVYFINLSTYLDVLNYSPLPLGIRVFYYVFFFFSLIFGVLSGVLLIKGK